MILSSLIKKLGEGIFDKEYAAGSNKDDAQYAAKITNTKDML